MTSPRRVVALLLVAGCTGLTGCSAGAHQPAVAYAHQCARPLEPSLAHDLDTPGAPLAVVVDFDRAPSRSSLATIGFVDCNEASCFGVVSRERLLRLCVDTRVRDIERWR